MPGAGPGAPPINGNATVTTVTARPAGRGSRFHLGKRGAHAGGPERPPIHPKPDPHPAPPPPIGLPPRPEPTPPPPPPGV